MRFRLFRIHLLLLAGAACCAPAPSGAGDPPRETWYRVLIGGKPAGYTRETIAAAPEGGHRTSILQRLTIRREETAVEMQVAQEMVEDREGRILGYRLVQKMSTLETVIEGKVRGDRIEIAIQGVGNPRAAAAPYDPEARGPRHLEERALRELRRPGDRLRAVTLVPEKNGCSGIEIRRGEEEEVDLPSGARKLQRRTTRLDVLPGVEVQEWVDPEGEVWKSSVQLLGMTIDMVRSTRERILEERIAAPPEIFVATSVRSDRPLRDAGKIASATFRLSLKSGDFESLGLEGAFKGTGQTLVREESAAVRVVRIDRVDPGKPAPLPVPAADGLEPYLAPSALIQSDDEEIRALARRVAGGAADALEAARKLERWVHDNIRSDDLRTALASAKETLETRRGDCTEYGVLLAALARAVGIPARVVTGLVYHQGAFYGHLWTEVYTGRWVPLDATRGRGEVGPDHIALAASPLADAAAFDVLFELARLLGNLKIEILEP